MIYDIYYFSYVIHMKIIMKVCEIHHLDQMPKFDFCCLCIKHMVATCPFSEYFTWTGSVAQ